MGDFLSFRRMITPVIIQIIFWFGVIATVATGLGFIASGNRGLGFAFVILGPLAVRVYCELLILFFRMNETLTDIRNELARDPLSARRPVGVVGQASASSAPMLQRPAAGTTSAITAPQSDPDRDTGEIGAEAVRRHTRAGDA